MNSNAALQHDFRRWVKAQQHPLARALYRSVKALRRWEVPLIRPLHAALYACHRLADGLIGNALRIMYWTPIFKSRLCSAAPRLYLFGGMPLVLGAVEIEIGSDCRMSGHTTISGRSGSAQVPRLHVGNNCDIGWQTTIAVGRCVRLGDNVRIAGRAFLAGYPGHPLDAAARARGDADTDDQVGDIVLESDVWLATGVAVMAGVHIGRGTVVAAGSVVTKDLPAGVLAGGVPARVIRQLTSPERSTHAH
jgi:acetyltransferase-like isoleucine patch superfamily enzyme